MALYDVFRALLTNPLNLTLGILSIVLPLLWHLRRGKQTQAPSNAPPSWPFDPASLDRSKVIPSQTSCTIFSRKQKARLIDKLSDL